MKKIKLLLQIFVICLILFMSINLAGEIYALCTPKFDIKSANSFYMYDNKLELVFYGKGEDKWIDLEDMNNNVINSTLAVEDKNFYKHNGFNFFRIAKAMFENLKSGKIVQGASTITQQYAKNLFLSFDKTWKRKWQEMWITFELETHYSKDEILEGYLNTINYGNNCYGIANASKFYFNKDVKDLTLAEASILSGIPNSPYYYEPINNYETAKKRQKIVLQRMYENKFITKEEMNNALEEELKLYGEKTDLNLTTLAYYKDAVMEELNSLKEIPDNYIETGGLKIWTSLDIDAQTALEKGIKYNLIDDDIQTSKVMMNSDNGEIIALIGGTSYNKTTYNRATSSIRQPGSTIKPFLYYNALENNFTPSTTFLSERTTFYFDENKTYSPRNADNIYANKNITMVQAIAYSDNIYAVKTHLFLGQENLVNTLRKTGITTNLEANYSLPLGTNEVNIIELTSSYAALANGGIKVKPHLIRKVEDTYGNILYKYNEKKEQILNPSLTFIISEMLTSTYDASLIDYAYPTCINMLSNMTHKYALKSGSTDTDAWVIGYTNGIVLASWSGYDDNTKINSNVVGGNKKSWINAMEDYLKDKESKWYNIPDNVVAVLIDPTTGNIATNKDKNKKIMYYLKGTEPIK